MRRTPRNRFVTAGALALALVGIALALGRVLGPPAGGSGAPVAAARSVSAPTPEGAERHFDSSIGFHSHERLQDHFHRHGREFGAGSIDTYLILAQALRDAPVGGTVLEQARADGVICRFDRASGAFLAFDRDGTIRTFFKPNDGENYFWRQLGRDH